MKRWGVLAVGLLLLFLVGCFDLKEEVWINADGSAKIMQDIILPEAMTSLGGEQANLAEQLNKQYGEKKSRLEADPRIKSVDTRHFTEGDKHHFVLEVEIKDVTDLPEIWPLAFANKPDAAGKGSDSPLANQENRLSVSKTGDGNIHLTRVLKSAEKTGKKDSTNQMGDAMGQAMAAQLFANNGITFTVHGSKIAQANGTILDDGQTAEWKIPLTEMMGKNFSKEMSAEIGPGGAGLPTWIPIAAGGFLVLLVLLILITRNRKKKSSRFDNVPVIRPSTQKPVGVQ